MLFIRQAGPAQHDLCLRPHGLQALRKGVDRRRDAIDRVRGHIAHPLGLGQHTGQQAQQIGHLIGAGIVGAHQRVRRVQRAVQDAGLGVLGRHLQAGGVHPGAGGEHHVGVVVGHFFQHLLRVHLGLNVLLAGDEHPVRESLRQRFAALVVGTHPGAALGVVLVQEHHPQLTGPGEDVQLGKQRFARALLGLQRKLHGLRLSEHLHLVPQLFHVLLHLRRGGVAGVRVAVDGQIDQQRIAGRQVQFFAAQGVELLAEHGVEGSKVQPVVVGPALARSFAHQRLQLGIAAQFGEVDIVHLGQLVEIQEFIINFVFQAVVALRDQTGDSARDLDGLVIFQHRDTLVAFQHIEFVQEFIGDDGHTDAFLQMRLTQVGPLGRELGVRLQQRHEVGRKGGVASAGLCAHNALGRDLHQAQRFLRHDVHIDQNIVQHRKIRRLAARHAGAVSALPRAQCTLVIFQHSYSFFTGPCAGSVPCCIVQPSIP